MWTSRNKRSPAADSARLITALRPCEQYGDNSVRTAKYTWLNMLPKAVYDQFRRVSNFYFLIVAAISFIPNISPTTPVTTTLPLVVVVGFGLARDVYEDTKRKRADTATNTKPVTIRARLAEGEEDEGEESLAIVKSRDVFVGDVVRVEEDNPFPADLLILKSSDDAEICYVSTANLDGESNLKRREIPLPLQDVKALSDIHVVAGPTDPDLYRFEGKATVGEEEFPLDVSNLLLRGSILRNTDHVYGLVIYNGEHTKVALNMRNPPSKLGGIERMMNRVVIGLFTILMIVTIIMALIAGIWQGREGAGQWYMGEDRLLSGTKVGLRSVGTFIILFHTFVPVSLFVTLEFVRLFQGAYISADLKMTTDGSHVESKANNLNESLGYIQHIFSDKTGTLTENVMRFVACFVSNTTYDLRQDSSSLVNAVKAKSDGVMDFVRAMALTHDVLPRKVDKNVTRGQYSGESPDEVSLVQAACDAGVKLVDRTMKEFVLEETGREDLQTYALLAELEFSSERKRMSTIFRCPDGQIRMFTKGADSVILPRLSGSSEQDSIERSADSFAKEGLRTLVYGVRLIPEEEYEIWSRLYSEACNTLEDRIAKKADLAQLIELELDFVGVTAVEDKLQENVPETIRFLRQAGIRIWVLTGDKLETAENIGYSSHLINTDMLVLRLSCDSKAELQRRLERIIENDDNEELITEMARGRELSTQSMDMPPKRARHRRTSSIKAAILLKSNHIAVEREMAMIIDGHSLSMIDDEEMQSLFLEASGMCKSVICARVTPLQKAEMVMMVRRLESTNTLAIGDGGNDVSMIQEAHIGVGIKGKEGMQAAKAADYSMGEFQHLGRLLAIHGRFSYIRTAGVINLSFYKNLFFSSTQILFQFFCFASGTTFHDQWIVTAWNAALTLLPPFLYGIFERDLEEKTVLNHPSVYQSNADNKLFSMRTVLEYTIAYSIWHALVLFFMTYGFFGHVSRTNFSSGVDGGFYLTGMALSTMAVPIALFKFLLSSHLWTRLVLFGIALSYGLLWALIPVFVNLAHEREIEGVVGMLFSSANYHLLWPLVFVAVFIPDFLVIFRRAMRKGNMVATLQTSEARQKRKIR